MPTYRRTAIQGEQRGRLNRIGLKPRSRRSARYSRKQNCREKRDNSEDANDLEKRESILRDDTVTATNS